MKRSGAALLAAALLVLAVPSALPQGGATVRAVDEGGESGYRFDPATLALAPGAQIVVQGGQAEPHTLTHDAPQGQRLFHSGNVDPGGSATFNAPPAPGEYPFICVYHPVMKGTLVVREEAATTPPTQGTPAPGLAAALVALALGSLLLGRRAP